MGREQEKARFGKRLFDFGKMIVIGNVEFVLVVEAGALELLIVQRKAERTHKMQRRARYGAGSGDIAGILGDFRFNEYDVKHK